MGTAGEVGTHPAWVWSSIGPRWPRGCGRPHFVSLEEPEKWAFMGMSYM